MFYDVRFERNNKMADEVIKLQSLRKEDIPADFRAETYFDFNTHSFEHQRLLEQADSVYAAILGIDEYATKWLADTIAKKRSAARAFNNKAPKPAHIIGNFEVLLEDGVVFEPARIIGRVPALRGPNQKDDLKYSIYVGKDARVIGTDIYLENGSIYIGAGTTVEPGVGIKGPVIIGKETELRQGAYLRGDCIIGNGCVIRGEIKNCVLMDKANFPHPSYLGDSLCGYMTHFGNQATTANLGIFAGLVEKNKRKPLVIRCNGRAYDIGNPKMGICMGDYSQVGCNCVSDPGTFLKPYTITYSLARISKGFYGPNEILKNKPLEHGVIERSPYEPPA
jgi:acetyltransferase-like isoleucine patch superfamily enzyme